MYEQYGFDVRQVSNDASIGAILREKELELRCVSLKELVELSFRMGLMVLPHERERLICKLMQRMWEESKAQEVGAA